MPLPVLPLFCTLFRARPTRRVMILLGAFALAACGGGGGGGEGSTTPASGQNQTAATYADGTPMDPVSRVSNTTCRATARPNLDESVPASTAVKLVPAFPGIELDLPIGLWQAPGDASRWFVAEKDGRILSFANDPAATTAATVLNIRNRVDASFGESGLLGVAIDPRFAANGRIYVSYTAPGAPLVSRISRFTSRDGGKTLDPATEEILLSLPQPQDNHNGGHIAFGPDGYLYIGFGDGGGAGDPQSNAQNPAVLLGKLLRIDVNAGSAYAIPADNPFVGRAGTRPEIFALGLRNPWRWSFDRATGELWLGDVGEGNREEVNKVVAGGNYGWAVREGSTCFNNNPGCNGGGFIEPLTDYGHDKGRCSITGGYVLRGKTIPELEGHYLYGDFCTGEMWSLDGATAATPVPISIGGILLTSFAEALDGQLYAVAFGPGRIYRLESGAASTGAFPRTLSATGCFDPATPGKAAAGVVPYEVNVPFWSDGSFKERYFALPDGTSLTEGSDHQIVFPIGSVVIKHVRLGNRLIETRLMMRHSDGDWGAYSYEWNAAQTDATLVVGGKTSPIAGQTWRFPTGAECLRCHTTASGRIIGAETLQTNRNGRHPLTGKAVNVSQFSLWKTMALSDVLPASAATLPALEDTSAPLASRARAWLHSNCAYCHRPGGGTPSAIDLRYETPLAATRTCGATPTAGNLGISGARVIKPGDPASSVLLQRVRRLDTYRMPPLGSYVVDAAGAQLLEDWIAGLDSCN